MACRFKGRFTEEERERISQSARTVEHLRGLSSGKPCWAMLHFQTPHGGYRYWGIRLGDGYTVSAHTAKGLSVALEVLRDEMIRLRSRALSEVSERAARPYQPTS